MKKILPIVLLIVVIMAIFGNIVTVSANGPGAVTTDKFKPKDTQIVNDPDVMNFGKAIISAIRSAGIVVVVITMIILGIKFMMGSAEQRAEYKKSMIPYLIGSVMIFAITYIISIIASIVADIQV